LIRVTSANVQASVCVIVFENQGAFMRIVLCLWILFVEPSSNKRFYIEGKKSKQV